MKKFKRNLSIILITLVILLGSIITPKPSIAAGNTVELYATHRYGNLLVRNGVDLTCIYIVYQKDGIEYPSYCLNLELDGATEDFSYSVNTDSLITDMEIWRTVVNGYPYKTVEELGCKTKEEAYLATRQAIYCAVYDRDPNSYGALGGEAGARTLKAMKQIVAAARNSTDVKPSATLNIHADTSKWGIDIIDNKYVSKEFTVSAAAGIKNYTINLDGDIVEGTKITDTNNKEKTLFQDGEKFKILIPIKNIEENGNFTIKASGEVATKPVIYGLSPSNTLQNVALTGSIYEKGSGSKTEYYFKNETKIEILKQNQETKEPLSGVTFQILNKDKEVIYSGLKTRQDGKLIVENLLPGKYYVQELETLEGYNVYDKLLEVNLKLNEKVKITVNNLHNEDIPTIDETETEIEVEEHKSEIEIQQNKTEISLEENKVNVELNKTEIELEKKDVDIEVNENNISIETNDNNIKVEQNKVQVKLPVTGM